MIFSELYVRTHGNNYCRQYQYHQSDLGCVWQALRSEALSTMFDAHLLGVWKPPCRWMKAPGDNLLSEARWTVWAAQRVEVRQVRRQTSSDSPATTPDGLDAVQTSSSTSVGRLNAVEQFRRNEAKRASLISYTSSLVSSDGTINVVTDSEDEDEQKAPATSQAKQSPSPTSPSAAAPTSPTRNGVPASPPGHHVAADNSRESSLSPQRDVTSPSGASPQPSKCVVSALLMSLAVLYSHIAHSAFACTPSIYEAKQPLQLLLFAVMCEHYLFNLGDIAQDFGNEISIGRILTKNRLFLAPYMSHNLTNISMTPALCHIFFLII